VRTEFSLHDVASLLRRKLRRLGVSLEAAVNRFLHLGLIASAKPDRRPFVVHPRPMGLPPGLSYDNIENLLETLEGPLHQ